MKPGNIQNTGKQRQGSTAVDVEQSVRAGGKLNKIQKITQTNRKQNNLMREQEKHCRGTLKYSRETTLEHKGN